MRLRAVCSMTTIAVLTIALVVGMAARSLALHRDTPVFVQVSNQPSGQVGQIAAFTPEYFGFSASGDVMGNGNSGFQVFFFDLELRVFQSLPGLKQITFGPYNATSPTMSTRGSRVSPRQPVMVFEADGMLCANPANNCDGLQTPMAGRQLFRYDTVSEKISQVTRINGGVSNPHISGNGNSILFDSFTDFLGTGAIGAVAELYQGDLTRLGTSCQALPCPAGGSFAGVTRLTTGGGSHGSQSYTGNIVAFQSPGDLLNNGQNPGTNHVYVLRKGVLRQLTTGGGTAGRRPTVSQNGKFVAFEWDRPASAGPPVSQIFVAKVRSQTVNLTQVTNGASGSFRPSIDPKARRLSFTSTANLSGTPNNGQPQVFTYNVRRGKPLLQVSGGPAGGDFSQSTTAAILGFASGDDFTGTGNNVPQFFVANTFREAPADFATPTPTRTPTPTITPTPTLSATATVTITPTATPIPGEPANVGLALLVNLAADNGNDTLTTVIAATVSDFYGNAVPDGTFVNFQVLAPTNGAIVTNGFTNQDPDVSCNIEEFIAATGQQITNQPGVANACVTYPRAQVGTQRTLRGVSGSAQGDDVFTLPPPAPTATATPTPTLTPTPTATTTP